MDNEILWNIGSAASILSCMVQLGIYEILTKRMKKLKKQVEALELRKG